MAVETLFIILYIFAGGLPISILAGGGDEMILFTVYPSFQCQRGRSSILVVRK